MIQIQDVVVSLDVFREKFLCDLSACKGACCIEGDAGAPLEMDEVAKLEEVLPVIWDELSPDARAIIDRQGLQMSCIEEIAWSRGWIDDAQLRKLAAAYGKSSYGQYLKNLVGNW